MTTPEDTLPSAGRPAGDRLALLQALRSELATSMGMEVTRADPDVLTMTMPVVGNRQTFGLLHGGANAALAETAGSLQAVLVAPEGFVPVGTELSCTHHRSVREGRVTATSTVLHAGRTTATMDITITDDLGRRTCTARLSCMFVRRDRAPA